MYFVMKTALSSSITEQFVQHVKLTYLANTTL